MIEEGELPEEQEAPPADVPTSNPDGDVIDEPDADDPGEPELISPIREDG